MMSSHPGPITSSAPMIPPNTMQNIPAVNGSLPSIHSVPSPLPSSTSHNENSNSTIPRVDSALKLKPGEQLFYTENDISVVRLR